MLQLAALVAGLALFPVAKVLEQTGAAALAFGGNVADERLARLEDLDARLEAIAKNKRYATLFESEARVFKDVCERIRVARTTVQKSVDALRRAAPVEEIGVDRFHNHLREFLINLQEMPPDHNFDGTLSPGRATLDALIRQVQEASAWANNTPGWEEVSRCRPLADASAADAVHYVRRSLREVYDLLGYRTLSPVTVQGKEAAKALTAALDQVLVSLDRMLDSNGEWIEQVDLEGARLSDQLAHQEFVWVTLDS